ncbi:MAG: ATP-binding protein [Oscillospiraceae bacterium]|nr:ATP-binding protein [Oscillospiraceae bacterium]
MKEQSFDFSESKNAEYNNVEEIRKLLQAVNKATALLLTTKEDENLESLMMESMALIGNSISVDRIHIWQYNKTDYDDIVTSRYCWLSETGKQKKTIPVNWTFSLRQHPAWIKDFEQGLCRNSPVAELPTASVNFFTNLDIKSLVIIPLFLEDKLWGMFSADDCVNERTLPEDELDILRSVSLMMASVITRHALVAKRTEELTHQTTMMTTLFNTIPDLVFVKDLASRYLQCNSAMYEFFDKMPSDIIGKGDIDGLGVSPDIAKLFIESDWGIFSGGVPKKYELMVPRADGEIVEMETIKAPLIYKGETLGLLGISRDVTEYKQMARQIEADYEIVKDLQAEADNANKLKSLFLASISHEIRTPVSTILGATELLLQVKSIPHQAQNWIKMINISGNLLQGIINDLLDISKIEAGEHIINEEEYLVVSVISDIIKPSVMRCGNKPVVFDLQIDKDIPAKLAGDEMRIKQILNNLISTAYKFTVSGNIMLSVSIEPDSEPDSNYVILVLSIKNTNSGMNQEQVDEIYEELIRFDTEYDYSEEGTGIGISITKQLVELMRGSIKVNGKFSKGTEFTVRLPQKVVGRASLGSKAVDDLKVFANSFDNRRERRKTPRDIMPYGKVLVVDDAESNSLVTVALLNVYKLQIEMVESGFAAIKKIESGNVYDVIFMDHVMPIMDGVEATMHLRDLGYTNPIVALTANAMIENEEFFLSNGFDEVVMKPVDIRLLTSVLNKYIRDKQPPDVLEAVRLQDVKK